MRRLKPFTDRAAVFQRGSKWFALALLFCPGISLAQVPTAAQAPPPASAGAMPPSRHTRPPAPAEGSEAPEPGAEAIDPELQAQYASLVTEAITEFNARRWAEARALFLRAHGLRPSARTLRTLGMTSFELSEYPRAINELSEALKDPRRPLDAEQRALVQSLLERAKLYVGRYQLQVVPENASLWVDGVPYTSMAGEFLQLSVGTHQIIARAPGHVELNQRFKVQGGEEQPLKLTLTRQDPPAPMPPVQEPPPPMRMPSPPATPEDEAPSLFAGRLWTWVAAGTGLALGVTSGLLWRASDEKHDRLEARCAPDCTPDDEDPETMESQMRSLQTAHQVTLGLAIAAGAGAVALFFIEGDDGELGTSVGFGPSGAQLTTHF